MSTKISNIKFDRLKLLHKNDLYKPEYCELILKLAAKPMNLVEISVELGVCVETVREWGRRHALFSVALLRAKEIHKSWFSEQMQKGMFDTSDKKNGNGVIELKTSRFNAQNAKLYAYINFGYTENSVNSHISCLPTNYATLSLDERQHILDNAIANHEMSTAQYESLSRVVQMITDRQKTEEAANLLQEIKFKN